MNTCIDCGHPVNRGNTSPGDVKRCIICEVARNPPPLPPRLEQQRLRRRVADTIARRTAMRERRKSGEECAEQHYSAAGAEPNCC